MLARAGGLAGWMLVWLQFEPFAFMKVAANDSVCAGACMHVSVLSTHVSVQLRIEFYRVISRLLFDGGLCCA